MVEWTVNPFSGRKICQCWQHALTCLAASHYRRMHALLIMPHYC